MLYSPTFLQRSAKEQIMQITLNIPDTEWVLLEEAHKNNFSSFSKQYHTFKISAVVNENNRYYNITISRDNLLKSIKNPNSQLIKPNSNSELIKPNSSLIQVQVLDKSTLKGTSSQIYDLFLKNPLKEFTKEELKPLVPVTKQTLDKHLRSLVRDKFLHAEYRIDHYVYSLDSGF